MAKTTQLMCTKVEDLLGALAIVSPSHVLQTSQCQVPITEDASVTAGLEVGDRRSFRGPSCTTISCLVLAADRLRGSVMSASSKRGLRIRCGYCLPIMFLSQAVSLWISSLDYACRQEGLLEEQRVEK